MRSQRIIKAICSNLCMLGLLFVASTANAATACPDGKVLVNIGANYICVSSDSNSNGGGTGSGSSGTTGSSGSSTASGSTGSNAITTTINKLMTASDIPSSAAAAFAAGTDITPTTYAIQMSIGSNTSSGSGCVGTGMSFNGGSSANCAAGAGTMKTVSNTKAVAPIHAFSGCYYVDNTTSASDMFIPFGNAQDWKQFISNHPASLALTACAYPDSATMASFAGIVYPTNYPSSAVPLAPDVAAYAGAKAAYPGAGCAALPNINTPNVYGRLGSATWPTPAYSLSFLCHNGVTNIHANINWIAATGPAALPSNWQQNPVYGPDLAVIAVDAGNSLNASNDAAAPITINQGSAVNLDISTIGALPSCSVTGTDGTTKTAALSNGSGAVSVTPTPVAPATSVTYTVTCNASNGLTSVATVVVDVNATKPVVTLTASAGSDANSAIAPSTNVTLTWTVIGGGVTACTATSSPTDGNWNRQVSVAGGTQIVAPKVTTTYSLVCTNAIGGSAPVLVTINVQGQPILVSLLAQTCAAGEMSGVDPTYGFCTIGSGVNRISARYGAQYATEVAHGTSNAFVLAPGTNVPLVWSISGVGPLVCTTSNNWSLGNSTFTVSSNNGTTSVTPAVTTTYTLECTDTLGTSTQSSTTVYVESPASVALWFTQPTIASGGAATINWSITPADETMGCTASGNWTGTLGWSDATFYFPPTSGYGQPYIVEKSDISNYGITSYVGTYSGSATIPAAYLKNGAYQLTCTGGLAGFLQNTAVASLTVGGNPPSGTFSAVNGTGESQSAPVATLVGGVDPSNETVSFFYLAEANSSAVGYLYGYGQYPLHYQLSWAVTNATSCSLLDQNDDLGASTSQTVSTTGTLSVNTNISSHTYWLFCANAAGTSGAEIFTNMGASCGIYASSNSITAGQSATLVWENYEPTPATTTLSSSDGVYNKTVVANNNNTGLTVHPVANTTYTLNCSSQWFSGQFAATVYVNQ